MRKWVWMAAAIALIILLVYGGLWSVERGIKDILSLEQPLQALTWQRNTAGEITVTFAGKTTVITPSEIYSRVREAWDKLSSIWR
ncbi:MAG TPA: hypothetical protein GX693_04625 [Firmicutes bacterium]|nr:hypothetical protein [Bacillota bacterium]